MCKLGCVDCLTKVGFQLVSSNSSASLFSPDSHGEHVGTLDGALQAGKSQLTNHEVSQFFFCLLKSLESL